MTNSPTRTMNQNTRKRNTQIPKTKNTHKQHTQIPKTNNTHNDTNTIDTKKRFFFRSLETYYILVQFLSLILCHYLFFLLCTLNVL